MLSVLINTHLLQAAQQEGVKRFFYASSACVYNAEKQVSEDVIPLKEADAYPAMPEDGYGWEKLFSERMCRHFREDYGLRTRVARFHNVYGPYGTWEGGREKAPAAMCRKIAVAKHTGDHRVEIWGDGQQTRSFCYVDDCVAGLVRLMGSDYAEPLNIGQDRLISIADLADLVAEIAGIEIQKVFVDGPQGVRGRNSDNTRLREVLDWEPEISLETGLERTYKWIEQQVQARLAAEAGRGEVVRDALIRAD
jgi:nucleoside-diphosphate-sugar epimerase